MNDVAYPSISRREWSGTENAGVVVPGSPQVPIRQLRGYACEGAGDPRVDSGALGTRQSAISSALVSLREESANPQGLFASRTLFQTGLPTRGVARWSRESGAFAEENLGRLVCPLRGTIPGRY